LLVYMPNEVAISLYRSLGFVEFGTEPEAIQLAGSYFDGMHMSLLAARHNKAVETDAQGRPRAVRAPILGRRSLPR
jgi:hypothetical protein